MDLQPYGPIEEAIQKSISPATTSPKTTHIFLWGVLATVVVGVIVYGFIVKQKNKNSRKGN